MNVSRRRVRTTPGASLGVPVEELGKAGRLRFAQLRSAIPGPSDRGLARQLDELERDGLIERTVYPEVPPRVEYNLTPLGNTLCPLIKQMWTWSVQHLGGGSRSPTNADH